MDYNESQKRAAAHREGPMLVLAGPGAGKTRTYAVPNVLEAARTGPDGKGCSLVLTDPKSEILRKTGSYLIRQGYEVR